MTGKPHLHRLRLAVLPALCVFLAVLPCSAGLLDGITGGGPADAPVIQNTETRFTEAARSGPLTLSVGQDTGCIQVHDDRTGIVWQNMTDPSDQDVSNAYVRENLYAPVILGYTEIDSPTLVTILAYSTEAASATVTLTDGGADAVFDFAGQDIAFTVQYRLTEEGLSVRIPADSIKETGVMRVVSIGVLPFFASARTTDDGYMFYPDGCGAVTTFKEKKNVYYAGFTGEIYGQDMQYVRISSDYKAKKPVYLPVFGMVRGSGAVFSYIEQGAEDAQVMFNPAGYQDNIYRSYMNMIYRYGFMATSNSGQTTQSVDKDGQYTDREVRYVFFDSAENGYGRMASFYREKLLADGTLKAGKKEDSLPLYMQLFMGATEQQALFNQHVAMTSYDRAGEILAELKEGGVANLKAGLVGWDAEGAGTYPSSGKAASGLGGSGGLKKLMRRAEELAVPVVLSRNYMAFDADTASLPLQNVVYTSDGLRPYTIENRYLLATGYADKLFETDRKNLRRWEAGGLAFDWLGTTLYHDGNEKKYQPVNKTECAASWQDMLARTHEDGHLAFVEGGNQYVLAQADWLYHVEEESSSYLFTDYAVPFFQMVVHGSIPYSGVEINQMYDKTEQMLRLVEYGSAPCFLISDQSPQLLMNSRYNQLFSSEYSLYKDMILETYAQLNGALGRLAGLAMTAHERLSTTLVKVTYEDGTAVYINYAKEDAAADGQLVPAQSYIVREAGT